MFIHGQLDALIPFDHTFQLKDSCNCPYELLLPENMDHNEFNINLDFLYPMIDFLKRHTMYRLGDTSYIDIPLEIYEIPPIIKEQLKQTKKINSNSFKNFFCVKN